jgi:hypothetical protein
MATSAVNSIILPAEFDSPMHTIHFRIVKFQNGELKFVISPFSIFSSYWACSSARPDEIGTRSRHAGGVTEWLERPALWREGQWFRRESEVVL